jgi:hypothetical protein
MTHCLVNHHTTGHLVFVLVSIERVMVCPETDNPASCNIRAVHPFFHAKNISVAEIHREIWVVHGQNIMSEGTVGQCCRMFKDGRQMFTMKSEVVRTPSVMSDDLFQSVDQKICERRRFTSQFQNFHVNFHNFHALFSTRLSVRLGHHKFCARWVPKMLTGAHKTQRMASALTFFRAIPQRRR